MYMYMYIYIDIYMYIYIYIYTHQVCELTVTTQIKGYISGPA